jgi:hypothetical protein
MDDPEAPVVSSEKSPVLTPKTFSLNTTVKCTVLPVVAGVGSLRVIEVTTGVTIL